MKNLEEYIKLYDLNSSICTEVHDFLKLPNVKWEDHWFSNSSIRGKESEENPENIVCCMPYDIMPKKLNDEFHNMLWKITIEYFDSYPIGKNKLPIRIEGMSGTRFNKYPVGAFMREHVDHIHTLFDGQRRGIPIITLLSLFNEDFTGGKLMINNTTIKIKKDQVVLFPSVFSYPHCVTKVLTGERLSSVTWAY